MGVSAVDRLKDIAILQIPGFELPVVALGNSGDVRTGDRIVVFGNPLGTLEGTVTSGIISGIRDGDGYKLFQMDAAVSKGNSGGPVVDEMGKVIGVTVAKITAGESLNFSIPINYVRGLLQIPLSGTGLAPLQSVSAEQSFFSAASEEFPKRWKSLASGSTKLIRIYGDHVYVETVLSNEDTDAGEFILGELKREGESWIGLGKSRLRCWKGSKWKWCSHEFAIELTLLTPQRIEGTVMDAPDDAKYNCGRCTYSKPLIKSSFTWIPE